MKARTIITIIFGIVLNAAFSQAPQAFKYQAVIRDTTGNVYPEKLISLKISILQGDITGEEVYGEIHDVWTDKLGLVNLNIGQGFVYHGNLSEIPWGEDLYFLRLMIDLDGAMNYQLLGTSQLLAVPYALYSESSGDSYWKNPEEDKITYHKTIGVGNLTYLDHRYAVNTTSLRVGTGEWAALDFDGQGNDHQPEWRLNAHNNGFFQLRRWNNNNWDDHYLRIKPNDGFYFGVSGPKLRYNFRGFLEVSDSLRVGNNYCFVGSNGKVGVGTNTPLAPMHIMGKSEQYEGRDLLLVHNQSIDPVSVSTLKIKSGNGNSSTNLQHNAESYELEGRSNLGILWNDGQGIAIAATNDTGSIRFETGGAGMEKERMRITENGKVAIGANDPLQYKLYVSTTAHSGVERGVVQIRNNSDSESSICNMYISSGDGGSTYLNFVGQNYIHWGGRYKSHTMLANNGKGVVFRTGQFDGQNHRGRYAFEFYRNLGNTYTYDEKVSITYEGNMGIGIINPQRKLHVNDVMRLEPRYSLPPDPSEGDIYMDGVNHVLKVYNGTEWKACW